MLPVPAHPYAQRRTISTRTHAQHKRTTSIEGIRKKIINIRKIICREKNNEGGQGIGQQQGYIIYMHPFTLGKNNPNNQKKVFTHKQKPCTIRV